MRAADAGSTQASPPGWPGIEARWTSSAKSGVGTAADPASRVWFTISHGIVNEVYFPTFDVANTRDFGFLVSDGAGFFSEEKRDTDCTVESLAPGVPAFSMRNRCKQGTYEIEKTVISDPNDDALVQRIRFRALRGNRSDYHVYALLSPHIGNHGAHNSGWTGEYKGTPMLFAQRGSIVIALACSAGFLGTSCGYVGFSDGWQDISLHKRMTWHYDHADDGNIALTAEVDLGAGDGEAVLALGFGETPAEAGLRARAALSRDFDDMLDRYVQEWQQVQSRFSYLDDVGGHATNLYRTSTAVLMTHRSKLLSGGMIASLSIPWGASKGDDDLGGYHLVWPRDLVESAAALLAAGDSESACQTLRFLMATQEADGHWPQNMWMDGTPYWSGVQMDETAFPILLADALRRSGNFSSRESWPMVRAAASFIVRSGPVTDQDRWEEDGGFSPFTLAAEVSALLAAADIADEAGESSVTTFLRETADYWNASIERWTYVRGTSLARDCQVDGYYVRIAPPESADASSPKGGYVPIKNRPISESRTPAAQVVSPDALALVRFGLRAPSDPRIVNTLRVIDALLKTETVTGPLWHRYDDDGYGEHEDGSGFDGTGIGRGWPLLAGERAHYELEAGHVEEATRLLHVMEAQTSEGGLMPEQVWDASDIPERELFKGRPSGSAMPLAWTHAEYVKLLRSLHDGKVFDMPPQTLERYVVKAAQSRFTSWRFNLRCSRMDEGSDLRIELRDTALIHWSADDWATSKDVSTADSGIGLHYADLPTRDLSPGASIVFTVYWKLESRWAGEDFRVAIQDRSSQTR